MEDFLPYKRIKQNEAKKIIEENPNSVILDVRTQEEFSLGHIKNAVNIPNEDIGYEPLKQLPDKEQLILVYCRSGHRSLHASLKLHFLGYTNIYEFGGINTWPYEIVK